MTPVVSWFSNDFQALLSMYVSPVHQGKTTLFKVKRANICKCKCGING